MKKGIYVYSGSKTEFCGVEKKINGQINEFSKYYDMRKVVIEKGNKNIVKSVFGILPLGSMNMKYENAKAELAEIAQSENNVHFVFLRYRPFDRCFLGFIKSIRDEYPQSIILLEIPTYPYKKELLKKRTMWPWYFKDPFYRNTIKKYVNRIVTYSEDDAIFGITTIKAMNGMDVDSYGMAKVVNTDSINMIAVAMMQPYHGFERIIKGLSTYYKEDGKRDIQIKMVGYGPELDYYKELTEKCNLTGRIVFTGKLEGQQLEEAYDGCDLALGSMGGYKIGIDLFSSIKLGEYLAKGLPVITGGKTLIFEKCGKEYNLDFPNDDTEIDINSVIEFFDGLYENKNKEIVRYNIHEFAKDNIDNHIVMRNIIEYLEQYSI